MLGWMIVFGLLAVLAGVLTIVAGPSGGMLATRLATIIFGVLFLVCVLTSLARGRA